METPVKTLRHTVFIFLSLCMVLSRSCVGLETGSEGQVENVSGTGLQTVPVYTVAGAGPAVVVSELEPLFTVTAPPDYFRHSDYAIVIDGHSMEPLIPHGAIVGVKLNSPFVANELYLAQIPYEGLVVKRVGVDREKNEFVFKSINPDKEAYPDFRLSMGECENVIIGRVVWIMWGY